jgi:hypothetical protein
MVGLEDTVLALLFEVKIWVIHVYGTRPFDSAHILVENCGLICS